MQKKRIRNIGATRSIFRSEDGYTLLELMVVLSILALMAGLVAPRVMGYLSSAKTKTAYLQTRNITSALELFRLDVGRYPTKEEGLAALVRKPAKLSNWSGPYLPQEAGIMDPWQRPFLYRAPGQHGDTDIYSLGADGADGGEDENTDVLGWETRS